MMVDSLKFDFDYLKKLILHAMRLHKPRTMEESTTLSDIRDYFLYLALDAIDDPALAKALIDRFYQLQVWLWQAKGEETLRKTYLERSVFYGAFLLTLEKILSLKHQIARIPDKKISKEDFMRSWRHTAIKLGLKV